MYYLLVVERVIGHIAWPAAIIVAVLIMKSEISSLLKRIKQARYKGVELDLKSEFEEARQEAFDAEMTIAYPENSFDPDIMNKINEIPEWVFIKSWQEIEKILYDANAKYGEGKERRSMVSIIRLLVDKHIIDPTLGDLTRKLLDLRNRVVHGDALVYTRGEIIEWLGLARSVKDRLRQRIQEK